MKIDVERNEPAEVTYEVRLELTRSELEALVALHGGMTVADEERLVNSYNDNGNSVDASFAGGVSYEFFDELKSALESE